MQAVYSYPKLETIDYHGQRWYETSSGKFFPSITTVLGGTEPFAVRLSLERWKQALGTKAEEIGAESAENGTHLHLLIERYLQDLPIDNIEVVDTARKCFNTLKFKLKLITELWGNEMTLYSETLEVAGRCDCIGMYDGRPCVIDFKTSRRTKRDNDIEDYKLQLAFYGRAHNELYNTNLQEGIILMAVGNGFPLEFKVPLVEQYNKLEKRVHQFYQQAEQHILAA